jgi:GT2 family glycosyltransferase
MSPSRPEVAAVVATRNRAARLEVLLHSLARQEGAAVEAVVVDDGSTDHTAQVVQRGAPGLQLRALRHEESRGPAAARNAGWQASKAPIVAFLDDDVAADPGWAAGYVAAARSRPGAVLQGRTEFDPEELARATVFWRSIKVEGPDPFFATCNIAYPRELLERLGGFDESFGRPAGEDTDLGWRAKELGVETAFVDGARVRHAVHQMGLIGMLRDARRVADNVSVVKRHPGVRSAYHRGVFWHPSHERILGLIAGLLLARRTRGASLVAALPYALLYARLHRRWPGALASLPGYAAIDLAQLLALASASARHRTLVL